MRRFSTYYEFIKVVSYSMLKLGHILYSNCFPPHAGIIAQTVPFSGKLVEGIPTELNRMLFEGTVDVSPSSSIEYALHRGRYLILPDLSISSHQHVRSIILESKVPIGELNNKVVALTSASATSVVLLRILLELQHRINPGYIMYEQGTEDPADRADAILMIGDLALTKPVSPLFPHRYDLGELWHQFTGLPFVFALWQVNERKGIARELNALYDILIASRTYGMANLRSLSTAYSERFGIPAPVLFDYWSSIRYHFSENEQQGLLRYYGYAAEIGAIDSVSELNFWSKS
jgi:chorismate dehydratase